MTGSHNPVLCKLRTARTSFGYIDWLTRLSASALANDLRAGQATGGLDLLHDVSWP